MAFNSVQSNFMAPYDFLVVGGKVVRQRWAVSERPLTGTACWVFQTSGVGPPRLLRVQLGDNDKLWHQAEADSVELLWREVGVQTGLSGVPILLNGINVCESIHQRISGTPMFPGAVTWDPETTRAAFTAIGCMLAAKPFIICVSVLEELTVSEFADVVRVLGVRDAILLGGSGDVNMWLRHTEPGEPGHSEVPMNAPQFVAEEHILMAPPRTGTTRASLGAGCRPLNALVGCFLP
jgi:hypothetical protein